MKRITRKQISDIQIETIGPRTIDQLDYSDLRLALYKLDDLISNSESATDIAFLTIVQTKILNVMTRTID